MKNSAKLFRALEHYEHRDVYNRNLTRSALIELAGFGFSVPVIAKIMDTSHDKVVKVTGLVVPRPIWARFTPKSLDALACVAVQYEDDEYVNTKMVKLIVGHGTDLGTVAQLTRIPLEELRSAIREG